MCAACSVIRVLTQWGANLETESVLLRSAPAPETVLASLLPPRGGPWTGWAAGSVGIERGDRKRAYYKLASVVYRATHSAASSAVAKEPRFTRLPLRVERAL